MVKPGELLGPDTLTVNERVLLHLRESGGSRGADAFPATQPGIANALGIRVNHVSRAVKQLMRDRLIAEGSARTGGEVRRRKVYAITPEGHAIAQRLAADVAQRKVVVVDETGERTLGVADARHLVAPATLTRLLALVDAEGHVDLAHVPATRSRELPKVTEGRPAPMRILGRNREAAVVRAWLREGPPILAVSGPRGVGRTALLSATVDETRPLFWWAVRASDTPDAILSSLAAFLADLGKSSLRKLCAAGTPEAREAARILARDLRGTDAVLVIDDVDFAKEVVQPFVDAVVESSAAAAVRVAVTSEAPLPRRAAFLADGLLQDMRLEGLDRTAARALLPADVDDAEFAKLYGLTRGNPLSIKLLAVEAAPGEYTAEERALLRVLRMRQEGH